MNGKEFCNCYKLICMSNQTEDDTEFQHVSKTLKNKLEFCFPFQLNRTLIFVLSTHIIMVY